MSPSEEFATLNKVVDGGDTEMTKKRKVRPPRPAARRMTYPVIGPNQVAVPTHLYKVHWKFNLMFGVFDTGGCGV